MASLFVARKRTSQKHRRLIKSMKPYGWYLDLARQLANNAGQEGALIVQEVKKRSGNEGFNVATGKYEEPGEARRRRSD